MSIEQLIENVRQWGIDKGITGLNGKGTLLGQLSKTQEELTETRVAAILYGEIKSYDYLTEVKDGIGDTVVTLILAAEIAGLSFEECLHFAYQEIKSRTGAMIDGQFVKDKEGAK